MSSLDWDILTSSKNFDTLSIIKQGQGLAEFDVYWMEKRRKVYKYIYIS